MIKKLFLICFVALHTFIAHGQHSIENLPKNGYVYGSKEGFKVPHVSSLGFDDHDWLWLFGRTNNTDNFQLDNSKFIIQRFNGASFQTIPLPNVPIGTPKNIYFSKQTNGKFYVLFESTQGALLYLMDPIELIFHRVDISFMNPKEIQIFPYKGNHLIFSNRDETTQVFSIDNTCNIKKLSEFSFPETTSKLFTEIFVFEDHFIMNEHRTGVMIFSNSGKYVQHISRQDLLIPKNSSNPVLQIAYGFSDNHTHYFQFKGVNGYFTYDPVDRTWKAVRGGTEKAQIPISLSGDSNMITDSKGGYIFMNIAATNTEIIRYPKGSNSGMSFLTDSYGTIFAESRDAGKEVFLISDGKLHHLTFEDSPISIFLSDYSIRAIHELTETELLVATESSGWYHINITTGTVAPFTLYFKGEEQIAQYSRAIFASKEGFWSNYKNGIIYIDRATQEMTPFIHYPVNCLTEDEGALYYGTNVYNLMRFDKEFKENSILEPTPEYNFQNILKLGDVIYGTTETGLLEFEKDTLLVHYPDLKEDAYLIALDYHKDHGILAGSRTGKLFRFNSNEKTFELIYQDPIAASIATILFDDHDRIWMNTFNGIVCYDPATCTSQRFSTKDGLSNHESNRYSAIKMSDGHFVVGMLRGINYFHPDDLKKQKIVATLRLTSLRYFNKDVDSMTTRQSTLELNNLQSIKLPAYNRNLEIGFGLMGIYEKNEVFYQYRFNNNSWVNLSNSHKLELINLAPGSYNLEIRALDGSLEIIDAPLAFNIQSQEFFYKTLWFYILCFIIVLGIGFWYMLLLKRRHKLKEYFSLQLIQTQQKERSRIAKELHDSIGQKLLLLKNGFLRNSTFEEEDVKLLDETMAEVREISHNLHPFQFERLGLIKSLEHLVNSFQRQSKIFYSAEIEDVSNLISKEKELFLFRMIQECITNVEKHSQATACNLKVKSEDNNIVFSIRDNGKGCTDTETVDSSGGLGMKSLVERAEYIGAYIKLTSEPKKGTMITINIPKK